MYLKQKYKKIYTETACLSAIILESGRWLIKTLIYTGRVKKSILQSVHTYR